MLSQLPIDLLREIAIRLPIFDLLNFCLISRIFNRSVSDEFWRLKLGHDHPKVSLKSLMPDQMRYRYQILYINDIIISLSRRMRKSLDESDYLEFEEDKLADDIEDTKTLLGDEEYNKKKIEEKIKILEERHRDVIRQREKLNVDYDEDRREIDRLRESTTKILKRLPSRGKFYSIAVDVNHYAKISDHYRLAPKGIKYLRDLLGDRIKDVKSYDLLGFNIGSIRPIPDMLIYIHMKRRKGKNLILGEVSFTAGVKIVFPQHIYESGEPTNTIFGSTDSLPDHFII